VPTAPYMRHPDGPIQAVALSDDGRWVVSAAVDSARVWGTQDGDLALELPVNGVALAAAVAPDSSTVAVGDSAGNVFVADIAGSAEPRTARAQEGVTALAFSADGQRLASGDRSGRIQLWDPETVRTLGSALAFPHAIRWLGFSDDGQSLIAQTDHWAHRLVIAPGGLTVVASRLLDTDLEAGVAVGRDEESLRLIGGRDLGVVDVEELSWQPTPAQGFDTALLDRDWSSILSLRINDLANVVEVTR
jgi:WD40 repeat protein